MKDYGFGLKINTVINRHNYQEDMGAFIRLAQPKRWKVLQVLPILGQNDFKIDDFKISEQQFQTFLDRHSNLSGITTIVPETNGQVKGSYAMVDPAGRFFDNATGEHNYSSPILEIGVENAIKQVNFDLEKFMARGGVYNWIEKGLG